MKVAIISINTGQYNIFFDLFYKSSKEMFMPLEERHWFVFSDKDYSQYREDVTTIKIQSEEWPFCTLKKYHYIKSIIKELEKFDYIFQFNANSKFTKKIDLKYFKFDEDKKELIAIKHIGIAYFKNNLDDMSESIKESQAYIIDRPYEYCYGGIIGGKSKSFIEMCNSISKMVDKDLNNKLIPIWHDESYFNKYIVCNKDKFKIMSTYNIYPEDCIKQKHIQKIFQKFSILKLVDKKQFFNVTAFKNKSIDDTYINGNLGNILFLLAHIFSNKSNIKQIKLYKDANFNLVKKLTQKLSINLYLQSTNHIQSNNESWFQSEKYFDKQKIKQLFSSFINKQNNIKILDKINFDNYVAITIRRGDYVTLNDIWRVMPKEYYINSYNKFFKGKQVIISSDEPQWIKENLSELNGIVVNDYTNDPLEILSILSRCKHHICSCSTFSWWIAWIGEHYDSKIVFPKQWFNHDKRQLKETEKDIEENIIPERWIKFE